MVAAFDPADIFRGLNQPAEEQMRFVRDLDRQSNEQMEQLQQAGQEMAAARAKKEAEERARHDRAEEREIAQQQWNTTLLDGLSAFMTKVEEDRTQSEERAAAAEKRELEALQIARDSKSTAEKSKFWAVVAVIVAVLAIVVSVVLAIALAPEAEKAPPPVTTTPRPAPSSAASTPSKDVQSVPARQASARPS